jgi:hypothetical protein
MASMHLIEQSEINQPARVVWKYVSTPELFMKWNEKVLSIGTRERFVLNHTFPMELNWKANKVQCVTLVTQLEAPRILELKHTSITGDKVRPGMEVLERYTLHEKNLNTRVRKDIWIKNSGVPLLLRPLIWFINRTGRRSGEDRLKALCESAP